MGDSDPYHLQKAYLPGCGNVERMSETGPKNVQNLHDRVVKKAAETIFRKYKVVTNIMGNKVADIDGMYPDLLAYEVFSIKPFLASDVPALIGIVETSDVLTPQLLDRWAHLKTLGVDKVVLIVPVKMKEHADALKRDLGDKFELHFFDDELNIN